MIRAIATLFLVCLATGATLVENTWHPLLPSWERMASLLIFCTVVALPVFLLLASTRQVPWWQLTLGALLFAALYVLLTGRYGAIYGPSYILSLTLRSTFAAYLFWFCGIWRNPRFPDVARTLPVKSFAVVMPFWIMTAIGFV